MPRRAATETDYRARLLRVQAYVDAHLDDTLTPAMLAKTASLSLHHFHRIFRGMTGESLSEYVRRLRLQRAARRLRVSTQSILEVALDAGYHSHEAFTRAFCEHFGVNPSEYREQIPPRLAMAQVPPAEVEIREINPINIAYMRHVGSGSKIPEIFPKLLGWAVEHRIDLSKARLFGLCPDDTDITPEEHLRFDVCIETDVHADAALGVARGIVPGGLYAAATHVGPYLTLSKTYLALIGGWLPQTRYELHDEPCVEAYIDNPRLVPEDQLRTEVWVRLRE